jgi:hypothetical protein
MSLESHSTSPVGRTGKPCALLAAVLLEIDRRGLFSNLHDHTPLALDIVPADDHEEQAEHARDDQLPARPLVHVVGCGGLRRMTMKL